MANSAQARKRARQAEKHRARNASMRSELRTSIKKVRQAIADADKEGAQAAYAGASPLIDRMARKGIIHKNTAARHKSRLNATIQTL